MTTTTEDAPRKPVDPASGSGAIPLSPEAVVEYEELESVDETGRNIKKKVKRTTGTTTGADRAPSGGVDGQGVAADKASGTAPGAPEKLLAAAMDSPQVLIEARIYVHIW